MRIRLWRSFGPVALLLVLSAVGHAVRAADNVELKLRPKAGETQKLAALIDQKISQTINGSAQTIQQTIGLAYSFAVQTIDPDGSASIKVTYDAVTFKQQGPMGNIEYDSTHPPTSVPAMAKEFAALAGQSFFAGVRQSALNLFFRPSTSS